MNKQSMCSQTEKGFTPIGTDTIYSKDKGYGWVGDVNIQVVEYGKIDSVHDDYIRAKNPITYMERTSENRYYPVILPPVNEAVFKVDLPNGKYVVTAVVGDYEVSYNQNRVGITNIDAQGLPMVYNDRLDAGYFQYRTFETAVTDGAGNLTLTLPSNPDIADVALKIGSY